MLQDALGISVIFWILSDCMGFSNMKYIMHEPQEMVGHVSFSHLLPRRLFLTRRISLLTFFCVKPLLTFAGCNMFSQVSGGFHQTPRHLQHYHYHNLHLLLFSFHNAFSPLMISGTWTVVFTQDSGYSGSGFHVVFMQNSIRTT